MIDFFRKKEIIPEALWAYRNRLPGELEVNFSASEDGGYVAVVENVPGCMTQGDSFEEVYQMLNYAIYDYFDIPKEYFPHVHSYTPPKELVEEMERRGEALPKKAVVFKTA